MPWRLFLALAGVSLLAHALVAFGTELVPDEAYYALWSRHLAWDYPDHPPGVAGLIAFGRFFFGEGIAGVRGPALLTALLVPGLLGFAVARTRGKLEARRLLWLLHSTLLLHVLGVITTPDTPLTLAWAGVLAGLLLLVDGAGVGGRFRWLLLATIGLLLGLALLSKLTGWALFGGLAAAGLCHRDLRRRLGGWGGLALVLGLALLVVAPWIHAVATAPADSDLAFQLARLTRRGSIGANLGGYLGAQVGLITPGIFLALALWARAALRREASDRDRLLLWLSLPAVGAFLLVALVRPVEANWVGPAWLAALVGAASLPLSRRFLSWSISGGLTLVLLTHAVALLVASPATPPSLRRGALGKLGGWSALAQEVEQLCPSGVVRVRGYGAGAELVLRLGQERVRVETPGRASAFGRWEQPSFDLRGDACELHRCSQPPEVLEGCGWVPLPRAPEAPQPRLCLSRLRCPMR